MSVSVKYRFLNETHIFQILKRQISCNCNTAIFLLIYFLGFTIGLHCSLLLLLQYAEVRFCGSAALYLHELMCSSLFATVYVFKCIWEGLYLKRRVSVSFFHSLHIYAVPVSTRIFFWST